MICLFHFMPKNILNGKGKSQISIRGSVHAATQAEIMNALLYKTSIEIQVTKDKKPNSFQLTTV